MNVKKEIITIERNIELLQNVVIGQCFYFIDSEENNRIDYMLMHCQETNSGEVFYIMDLEDEHITPLNVSHGKSEVIIYDKVDIILHEKKMV